MKRTKKRIWSMILATALLLSLLPSNIMRGYSEEADESVDYSQYVGYYARFNTDDWTNFVVAESVIAYDGGEIEDDYLIDADDIADDCVVVIEDYYVDEEYCTLWYQISAAPGCVLPEALGNRLWVFQNWTDYDGDADSLSIDTEGELEPDSCTDATSDITVSAFNLPEDAVLSVTNHSDVSDGSEGIYDIKILDADGNEWQPIDEGKTVTISIPVPDVADGEYVDVYHFLDYLPAIQQNSNVQYLSLDGADMSALTPLEDAIAASDQSGFMAVEVAERICVSEGVAQITANSFSVYYYKLADNKYTTGDANAGTTPANLSGVSDDDGKYYFANRGDYIYFYGVSSWETSDSSTFGEVEETEYKTGVFGAYTVYRVQVKDTAEFYKQGCSITSKSTILNTEISTINIVVIPVVTIKYETHYTNADDFMVLPASITDVFLGNYEGEAPTTENELNELLEAGNYPAMKKDLGVVTFKDGVEGYYFNGWYLKHDPSIRFEPDENGDIYAYLSDDNLQVKLEDGVAEYEITLVADITYDPHKITYYSDANTKLSGGDETYLFENAITIKSPADFGLQNPGYTFVGWRVESDDPVQNWTTAYTLLSAGSTLENMYGDVKLIANWVENGAASYSVQHWFENVAGDGYEMDTNVDTLYSTAGLTTDAGLVKRVVAGFEVESIDNQTIQDDGSTVATIKYKRLESTITFLDPLDSNKAIASLRGRYGTGVTGVPAPEKEHYEFMGWYTADYPDQLYTPSAYPATNLTLYAKWNIKKVTITFVDDDGTTILYKINQDAGTAVEAPSNPKKEGYFFVGWDKDVPTEMPDEDIVIKAQWKAITYKIHFNLNGGGNLPDGVENPTEFGVNNMPNSIPVPEREGYTFEGWYADEECTGDPYTASTLTQALTSANDSDVVEITVYAKWEQSLAPLTIKVSGCDEELDPDQTFIFTVTGNGVDLIVTVCGNGSTVIDGLVIGEQYTITMQSDWSWRYTPKEKEKKVTLASAGDTVEFIVTRSNDYWLDDNA